MMMEWQAGRELDREIAEKIFRWSVEHIPGAGTHCWTVNTPEDWHAYAARSEAEAWDYAPYCSTDMAAAWQVVEHLNSLSRPFLLELDWHGPAVAMSGYATAAFGYKARASAGTAPLAICRAALMDRDAMMPAPDSPAQGVPTP